MKTPADHFAELPQPLGFVAHDAGSANLIAAWIADAKLPLVSAMVGGPATAIFARWVPHATHMDLSDLVNSCRTVVSGTGWSSTLEHDARLLARQAGCLDVAVIDHWTDYRQRFTRHGSEVLPDILWVTDTKAKLIACECFPGLPVVTLPNTYLDTLVAEVRKHELPKADRTGNFLYVLEPIRNDWGPMSRPGEFLALDYFIDRVGVLGLDAPIRLRLRPHPSDPPGKYDEWMHAQAHLQPELDRSPSLESALAWADSVAGCQTYAMVVALAAGRRVICTIPPGMPVCALPQTSIVRLAQLQV